MYPNLSLSPEPIITKWRTWLSAVKYYCEHFEKIKEVVSTFGPISAILIFIQIFNKNYFFFITYILDSEHSDRASDFIMMFIISFFLC